MEGDWIDLGNSHQIAVGQRPQIISVNSDPFEQQTERIRPYFNHLGLARSAILGPLRICLAPDVG